MHAEKDIITTRGFNSNKRGCKNERNKEKETDWASAGPRALLGFKSN